MNKLYFDDNFEILRRIDDERVHLICPNPKNKERTCL